MRDERGRRWKRSLNTPEISGTSGLPYNITMNTMRTLPIAILAAAALAGCAPPRAKTTVPAAATGTPVEAAAPKGGGPEATSAKAVAQNFLAALSKGEAKASQLGEAFKKQIFRPLSEKDRAVGYSDFQAQNWLDKFAGATYKVDSESSLMSNGYTVIGTAAGGPKLEYFVLRMAMLPGRAPEVSWLHRSSLRVGDRATAQPVSPDLDAARDFLEVAGSGDDLLTPALLAAEFRADIAAPHDSDRELGYNPGMLKVKMSKWKASAASIAVGSEIGQFTGELTQADKKAGYTLKMGNFQGRWLVESFDVK